MRDDSLTFSATSDMSPEPRRARPDVGARLRVVHPPELLGYIELPHRPLVVGRDPETPEGKVRHKTVSRRHLELCWRDDLHHARDLGSHNGSWLDGEAVGAGSLPLHDGAVLRLGSVVAVYEVLPDALPDAPALAARLPGACPAVVRLRSQLARVAPDPSPVLVTGPTGAGKEHVVRAVHDLGDRRGPLVAVNVAELSPQLVESQLFGHAQGAFTGAGRAQRGLFREAEGGTLFLDEIGELALDLQPKLLRVIQEGTVRPVGSAREEPVDVRVVAATHRDLAADVDAGAFRRDLFARLSLLELRVPSLTDRRADIPEWIQLLYRRWCTERGRVFRPLRFDGGAMELLLSRPWPENLRGLDRLVHRLALDADDDVQFSVEELVALLGESTSPVRPRAEPAPRAAPDARAGRAPARPPPPRSAEELADVLGGFGGSVRRTAQHYGRDRRQVYRWMKAFGLERSSE